MPGKVLLDTNVIIAFLSGEKAISKRFMESEVFVSSTALGELYLWRAQIRKGWS
jgi:predicted nucleic acid-binding protein